MAIEEQQVRPEAEQETERPPIADEDGLAEGLILDAESDWDPVLSVVMPTLNEEEGVADCIDQVKTAVADLGVTAEVIVSDSSTDRTPEIAEAMGAIVVSPEDEGYGAAYQHAFEHVRGKFVVMGDADCTYDFAAIPTLLEPVVEGVADIVLGSRLDGEIEAGAMPALHRYVGNPLLTRFLNSFYDAGVSDAHSGFRVLTREALEEMELQSPDMEFASEMVMDASARGLSIEEVPITYHERVGEETLDSFQDGWRHVKFMLVNAPGYLFSVPGALMAQFGVTVMAMAYFDITLGSIGFGIHSMIAGSLLTIVGYPVASMGMFATVAGDPIRKPSDPVTEWLLDRATLERGATVGVAVFGIGAGFAAYMVVRWVESGFTNLPFLMGDVVALTAIVLGVQTVFGSFFMSAVAADFKG